MDADFASLSAEASRWVVRHDRGLTPEEAEAFARWEAEDPRHRALFARLQSQWRLMDRMGAVPALSAMATAVESKARASQLGRRQRRRWMGLAAAAAAAIAAVLVTGGRWHRPTTAAPAELGAYVVVPGSAQTLTLSDASVAELRDQSSIVPEFVSAERRVKLVAGEVLFHVSKNPARPFVVVAGPVTVNAVGTAFDVRLEPGAVEVLVTEGKVALRSVAGAELSRLLLAGDHAIVQTGGGAALSVGLDRPGAFELDRRLAWESTRLVFDRTPLPQVVEAFNRFNTRQLILGDRGLEGRTLTGTFRADNLTGFLRLIGASVDAVAQSDGPDRIVLQPAAVR